MDYHSSGSWSCDGVCRGVVYPTADPCDMGDDEQQCCNDELYDELYLWVESNIGDYRDGYHNLCGGLFSHAFDFNGFRVGV